LIASKLKPSLLLKSVATSVHCPQFKCFISTAKRGLFSKKVSTVIYDGDPGVTDFRPLLEMVYSGSMPIPLRLLLHDKIAARINEAGEHGIQLQEAVRDLYLDMRERELIYSSPAFEWENWDK
jgi:hypothetical protein